MAVEYYYADPTGNITLLAPLPDDPAVLAEEAAALMAHEPAAEQVGFLSGGGEGFDISLQMAGGEFCGNATLSAAAVYARSAGMENAKVHVRVSGAVNPVSVQVQKLPDGAWSGTVSMPLPLSLEDAVLSHGDCRFPVTVVQFPGITHLVTEAPVDRDTAESGISSWCTQFRADALGLILLDTAHHALTPLVYVRKSSTLFWESSCASGTAAAGAVFRAARGPGSWIFREPAGSLRIDATAEGDLLLTGNVTLEKHFA